MKASESIIEKIKDFEGFRARAYKPVPTEKYYTIGYGHYGIDVGANRVIDKDMADVLLRNDVKRVEKQIATLGLVLPQNKYDALVDFVYNLGIANLKSSTLLKKIRLGRPTAEIQAEFKKWVHSNKKVLPGLVKRRNYEAALWAMK